MSHKLFRSTLAKATAALVAAVAFLVVLAGWASANPSSQSAAAGGSSPGTDVTVNCLAGTIDVRVVNPTSEPTLVVVEIDGQEKGYGPLAGGDEWNDSFPAVENQVVHIESVSGNFVDDVKFDCAFPEPAYEVIADCATGQAHARLTNTGNDVASIGVAYPGLMHMEIDVAPGAQHDWLLMVGPGETVDFDVLSVLESIGHEHFEFECEAPVIEPSPTPTTAAVVAAEAPDETPAPTEETVVAEVPPSDDSNGTATALVVDDLAAGPESAVDPDDGSSVVLVGAIGAVSGLVLAAMAGLGFLVGRRSE
jgi:hypothetical protein